jgi:hypothetical protein
MSVASSLTFVYQSLGDLRFWGVGLGRWILLAGGLQMCVISYLASKAPELRMTASQSVDSLGIKWSGAVASGKLPVPEGIATELDKQELPETLRRALGWK